MSTSKPMTDAVRAAMRNALRAKLAQVPGRNPIPTNRKAPRKAHVVPDWFPYEVQVNADHGPFPSSCEADAHLLAQRMSNIYGSATVHNTLVEGVIAAYRKGERQ